LIKEYIIVKYSVDELSLGSILGVKEVSVPPEGRGQRCPLVCVLLAGVARSSIARIPEVVVQQVGAV